MFLRFSQSRGVVCLMVCRFCIFCCLLLNRYTCCLLCITSLRGKTFVTRVGIFVRGIFLDYFFHQDIFGSFFLWVLPFWYQKYLFFLLCYNAAKIRLCLAGLFSCSSSFYDLCFHGLLCLFFDTLLGIYFYHSCHKVYDNK